MKISKVEPIMLRYYPKHPPRDGLANIPYRDVLLVSIETDEGIAGIGEGFALGCLYSVRTFVEECLQPLLLGENPMMIERLWNKMYRQTFRYGKRGVGMAAISAVDIALWDILGKKAGLPICQMLGCAHEELTPYASAGYYAEGKSLRDLQEEAAGYKKAGFRMMKMKVGGAAPEEDMNRIAAVREAIGTDMALAVDANNAWDYNTAVKMARFCEGLNICFLEEPLSSDFWEDSVRLAQKTSVPIAGYETELPRFGLKNYIVHHGVDIVQTDVIWSGGISEAKKIGALAAAWNKPVLMHFSASMVSLAANLNFALSIENAAYFEYTLDENPLRDRLSRYPVVMKDGVIKAPLLAGIGVELDWDVVEEFRIG